MHLSESIEFAQLLLYSPFFSHINDASLHLSSRISIPPLPRALALFIPSSTALGAGALLNVRGNSLSGSIIETQRNDRLADASPHQMVSLGEVADEFVVDFDGRVEGERARSNMEEVVLSVRAPAGSLRNVSEGRGEVYVWIYEGQGAGS
jgi:hypothetical protein